MSLKTKDIEHFYVYLPTAYILNGFLKVIQGSEETIAKIDKLDSMKWKSNKTKLGQPIEWEKSLSAINLTEGQYLE